MIPNMIAGDDWELRFTILNPDGSPFNLSGAPTILWMLLDKTGKHMVQTGDYAVAVLDALNGVCAVNLQDTITTKFSGNFNFYTHALRIVSGGITATPFTGQMNIISDPWAVTSTAQVVKFTTDVQSKVDIGSPLRMAGR